MESNFSFDFQLQECLLKIFFSCDKSINQKCKITLFDKIYKSILYSYSLESIQTGMNYHFTPPTLCVFVGSKSLTLKIENIENEVVFIKDFQIEPDINIALLHEFPDILKYESVYLAIIGQIFSLKMYEAYGLAIEKDDVVVDIGANYGIFTYFAFYKKPSKIYVCEPNSKLFSILQNHFSNYKNIHLDNCAISKQNGFADFVLVDSDLNNDDGQRNHLSLYEEDIKTFRQNSFEIVKTKTKSFMEFVLSNQIHKIDFLKVDCEGGEYDIFTEENASYIRNNVDKIVVEYHNYANQIVDFAIKNDFIILNEIKDTNCDILFLKNKNEPRK